MSLRIAAVISMVLIGCKDQVDVSTLTTVFEQSNGRKTVTYEEGIQWWRDLEEASPYVCVQTFGETDAGKPLHLVVINAARNFSLEKIKKSGKAIWLINNGIHPGEPDGIDASMLFARDILAQKEFEEKFDSTVILIIPFYNVGGALNRNCCSRANQNGPESYGFRGNAKNLDLNRDFIKCDSKNARSFNQMFAEWNPDVYLETHVSNGADYSYTMTYLSTQPEKLGATLGGFLRNTLTPELYTQMEKLGDEMIPYVNVFGISPDSGYATFYDSPRYSTGYAALHHSIGLLTETHMLKPFDQRVESTRRFLHVLADAVNKHGLEIKKLRMKAMEEFNAQTSVALDWEIDSSQYTDIYFSGYEAYHDTSSVTKSPQLYYDRDKPWEHDIPYWDYMKPSKEVAPPKAYLIPVAWGDVVDLLKSNRVEMTLIESDTTVEVAVYEIGEMETAKSPYEGHYYHSHSTTEKQYWAKLIPAGTYYLAWMNQPAARFMVETLEPEGPDSYFNWNFFDEILQQKEWFSAYVFDREAAAMLSSDTALSRSFEEMKKKDASFASNSFSQLYYLFRNSNHYEREQHMIYPVFRIE